MNFRRFKNGNQHPDWFADGLVYRKRYIRDVKNCATSFDAAKSWSVPIVLQADRPGEICAAAGENPEKSRR